jgi:NSS family neurotransmitter:Na+ symporter
MCTVFAVLPEVDARMALGAGNEGLTFIWLPRLFEQIPGGRFSLSLFFLALSFAAMSSLIAMIEMATRICVDLGMKRKKAVPLVGVVAFLMGLPSAWKLGVFQNQDWVWGLGLMVSGFLISLAVTKYGAGRFRDRLINTPEERAPVGRWYIFVIKYVVPLEFLALMIWWFYQAVAVYDPDGWWNPFHTFSLGTTIAQWGVLIAVLILVNRIWAARVGTKQGD